MTYEQLLEIYMGMTHDDLAHQLALRDFLEMSGTNTDSVPGINIPTYPYTPNYPYNPYWPNQIWCSTSTTEPAKKPTFGPRNMDC